MSAGCKHTDDRGINILQRDIIIFISWDENEREAIWLSMKNCGCARAAYSQRNRHSPSCIMLLMAFCTHQWHCREQSCLRVSSKEGSEVSAPLLFLWFLKWALNEFWGHMEEWMLCWHMNRLLPRGMEPGLTDTLWVTAPHIQHRKSHIKDQLLTPRRCVTAI